MTRLEWAGASHVGNVRSANEDQFVAGAPVFVVADGMGGHDRGDVASGIVADSFAGLVGAVDLDIDAVERVLADAQQSVRRLARRLATEHDMGTTLVALVLLGHAPHQRWLAVNVGDSRAYRLASGVLEQLSIDHSLVQEMVAAGSITASQARTHRDRNIVTRAMGVTEEVVPDFTYLDVVPGERFLLCSDGVHGELTDEQIRVLLRRAGGPQEAVESLVEAVLRGDARDNLTVVVVDTLADDEVDPGHSPVDEDTSPIAPTDGGRVGAGVPEVGEDRVDAAGLAEAATAVEIESVPFQPEDRRGDLPADQAEEPMEGLINGVPEL